MSPIPNEVFMEIFKYLRPPGNNPWIDPVYRRDFLRVALVCRFFCSVMLPWIFESLEFAGKNPNGHFTLNHAPFCRNIIRGCKSARTMATYVKRCSFSNWIQDEYESSPSWCNTEFQILYSRALAFMPNVEELKLTKICINKYLLKSIMELKCLTSLSLDFCLIGEVKTKDIRKLSTLRLKYLRFFGSPRPLRLSVNDDDDTLFISRFLCLDSLITMHSNCWPFVARIAEQNCHLPLQELDISEVHDVGLLPKIFQKTPALEKLRISSAATSKHDVQFDDVLPALDELCCPLFLLRSLVPGRPISSIKFTINSSKEITDIQSLFKKSTRKIHSLCVPIHVYHSIPLWEHFPELKTLRLELFATRKFSSTTKQSLKNVFANYFRIKFNTNSMQIVSSIGNAWPHNPPIQELHIDLCMEQIDPFFDLELQNKLISTVISARFPQVRRISISDNVVWNKVQEDDVWKPSLHILPLIWVAKRLRSGKVNFVDYDGFFEQILSTAAEFW